MCAVRVAVAPADVNFGGNCHFKAKTKLLKYSAYERDGEWTKERETE